VSEPAIRPTAPQDRPAVLHLVGAAFSDDRRDGHEEVEIVEQTWAAADPGETIDLVADDAGTIVGHVLAAPGRVDDVALLAVAPLGVAPTHQRRGVGSALMTELLQRAGDSGRSAVVLLGAPDYYRRFGFEPAAPLGVVYDPVGPGSPHFQVRRLTHDPLPRGSFRYIWER
jgi:predicted N-acetyltransferase YhbS